MIPPSRRGIKLDDPGDLGRRSALKACNARIRACRSCHEAGYLSGPASTPAVFDPELDAPVPRILLIGQAPGLKGNQIAHPFEGPSGDRLRVWLEAGGIPREDFWRKIHFTAVTRCYPGRIAGAKGDRLPTPTERTLCRPWLDKVRGLVDPEVILLLGLLAIRTVFGPVDSLSGVVGISREVNGVRYLPLPHPSGVSRWLNDPANVEAVARAMTELRRWVDELEL